jgi:HK97 family phage prohead protease
MNFQVKSNFELKDIDEKAGIVTGYCAIMGNIDSDLDMIMPGAFTKTLQERGPGSVKPRIKHLWQHDSFSPIGIPIVLNQQEKGMQSEALYFETQFGKDQFSQDKLQQHIDGIITELSIGFQTIKAMDEMGTDGKLICRKLLEIKLWEYSSVTWGANSLTEVISAKGETVETLAELTKRLESLNKALKNGKYTDESAEQFESEINKIQAIIKTLNIKEPVITTPDIVEPSKLDESIILKSILNSLRNE